MRWVLIHIVRLFAVGVLAVTAGIAFVGGGSGCGGASQAVDPYINGGETDGPEVVGTVPANGADDAQVDGAITVTFSKSIDAASVNGSSFVVEDESAATVAGAITYEDDELKLTFTPDQNLDRNAIYTVYMSDGITDLDGVSMAAPYAWSFSTDGAYYVSTEGDDAGAGTLNYPWRTIVHAVAEVDEGDTVRVLAGTYVEDEPIVIDKSMILEGEDRDQTIILPPATFGGSFENEVILTVVGADDNLPDNIQVVVRGFTIDAQETPGLRFCILLRGGAYAAITDNILSGAMRSNGEVNSGNISVGWNDYGYKARALIQNNIVTDFHSFGIAVYGAGNEATIDGNDIVGNPDMHICSSNPGNWAGAMGIVIQSNDSATVTNNYLTNMRRNPICDPACYDSAVELYRAGELVVEGNTFDDNDYGLGSYPAYMSGSLYMDDNEIIDNDVGAQLTGVTLESFEDNVFSGNTVDTIP